MTSTKHITRPSQRDLVAASLIRTGSARVVRWDERTKTTYAARRA